MSKKKGSLDLIALEKKALKVLKKIAYDIDSPDLGTMYDAVGRLASHENSRSLLPKAMELLESPDQNIKQASFTVAGKFAFGEYTQEVFSSLKSLNPVEREQVLQGIQEKFYQTGGPDSNGELKLWIKAIEGLGKEHQRAVFGLMRSLGEPGKRWVTKQIKEHGLKDKQLTFAESGLRKLVREYTREAGVRNLEREIASICRKFAKIVAQGNDKNAKVTSTTIIKYLGHRRYR